MLIDMITWLIFLKITKLSPRYHKVYPYFHFGFEGIFELLFRTFSILGVLWACPQMRQTRFSTVHGTCSSVSLETRLRNGRPGFSSRQGQCRDYSLRHRVQIDLGPTQPPIKWIPGDRTPGIKWPRREADHSPPPDVEVKNNWSYICTLHYVFIVCLIKRVMRLHGGVLI
jgi:hypothetical protein